MSEKPIFKALRKNKEKVIKEIDIKGKKAPSKLVNKMMTEGGYMKRKNA